MAENQPKVEAGKGLAELLKELEGIFGRIKSLTGETIAEVVGIVNDHLEKIGQPKIELDPKLFEKKVIPVDFKFQDSFSKISQAFAQRDQRNQNKDKLSDKERNKVNWANTVDIGNSFTQGLGGGLSAANKELSSMMSMLGASGEDMAVVNGIGGALEGLSSIDFKNPVSWVTGTMQALSSIFGIADAKKQAQIARLQTQIQDLGNEYKQLQHEMENCYSDDINDNYENQLENLEKQKAKTEEMARLEASKKKSDKSKIAQYNEQAAA